MFFVSRLALFTENLALRQQLAIYQRTKPRSRLRFRDRFFWVLLSKLWSGWKSALVIVKPETVIRWHRFGFRLYWRWKSGPPGRPKVAAEIRRLIRQMSKDNPLWGAPRIQAELRLLGHEVAKSTVAKYMVRQRKPPSQTWKTFLKNHVGSLASCDFFTVPTAMFQVLYVFVILRHDRREVVHFNVTSHPTAQWISQQFREAFPFETAPKYLIRDRDELYCEKVQHTIKGLGTEEVVTAPHSPWQNPYVERLVGSIRRECLDHVIVLNELHLMKLLRSYFDDYYHVDRCHQALDGNAPVPREVEPPKLGPVVSIPKVGGLHHRYTRAA